MSSEEVVSSALPQHTLIKWLVELPFYCQEIYLHYKKKKILCTFKDVMDLHTQEGHDQHGLGWHHCSHPLDGTGSDLVRVTTFVRTNIPPSVPSVGGV